MSSEKERKLLNRGTDEWLLLDYQPVTLFSLRLSLATSAGGKTLLVPTPFAFKMGMVDAAVRQKDLNLARQVFEDIKGREIRFSPPDHAVVNQTFVKVLRPARSPRKEDGDKNEEVLDVTGPYTKSIAYRELIYYQGRLTVALGVGGLGEEKIGLLTKVAAHICYLGKRGGFMQFLGSRLIDAIPSGFTCPAGDVPLSLRDYAVSEFLDDLGSVEDPNLFERINVYSDKSLTLEKHRVLVHNLIPYHMRKTSKGYTAYSR